ncbi:MAG TPA: TetR family transcriptional regulator [Chloroflexota bacterium]
MRSPAARSRDPERTRQCIFDAALREFVSKGYAGARVERIAKTAGVNKRLLYHYFGNKSQLFLAIISGKVAEKTQAVLSEPEHPAKLLPYWFGLNQADQGWMRMVQWEALQLDEPIAGEERRRAQFAEAIRSLAQSQRKGLLRADLPLEESLLLMLAVTMFPFAFPQYVALITGLKPQDACFQERWLKFLKMIGGVLLDRW